MKKILLYLLILSLITCCVGCAKSNNGSNHSNNNNNYNQNENDSIITSSHVIKCLQKIPCIIKIEAVTEDNDPIGQLNKPGGYTSLVYFSYELVDQEEVYGDNLIDKGTDAGGCIEVYTTETDANTRNNYLALFDGGILSSGSHTVVGTIVVRTSDKLTATQQKLLESNIISALQGQYDKIVDPKTNNNDSPTKPSGNTQKDAINDANSFANNFLTEYPNSYLTPNYIMGHLKDTLGYSEAIAIYAVENCNISWTTHAKKYVQVYLTYEENFGRPASWWDPEEIKENLLHDGFSLSVVAFITENIDWNEQAIKYVQHLSNFYGTFNRFDAKYYLKDVVSSESGIDYLLENSDINWKQHALNMANKLWAEYREYETMTLADVEDELSRIWLYTPAEIEYALNNMLI